MNLDRSLLDAIWRAAEHDEAVAERLAQRWRQTILKTDAAAQRIRAKAARPACCCALGGQFAEWLQDRCERCAGYDRHRGSELHQVPQ